MELNRKSSSSNSNSSNAVGSGNGGWFIDSFNGNIKEEYHFIEKIASGGFGVVYLAEHRKTSKYEERYIYISFKVIFTPLPLSP